MDAMVSARVGVEKRDRANDLLKSIGSTPTQLINSAYDYLIQTGKLPQASDSNSRKARTLDEEQLDRLRRSIAETTYPVPANFFEGKTDKQLLAEALKNKYGALSE